MEITVAKEKIKGGRVFLPEFDNLYELDMKGNVWSMRNGMMSIYPSGGTHFTWGQVGSKTVRVLPLVAKHLCGMREDQFCLPKDFDWTNTHPDNVVIVDKPVLDSIRRRAKVIKETIAKRERRARREMGITVRARKSGRSKSAFKLSRFKF